MSDVPAGGGPVRTLLRSRAFCLLVAGELFWQLGNQFYLIALPWLVLRLTGDAAALGQVLLLSGVPRFAFMPLGGALSDRVSPRALLLVANAARTALVALLAGLVLSGRVEVGMLYAFSLAYGLVEALSYPARSAIAPLLAPPEQLLTANSLTYGVEKIGGLVGPALAGLLIAGLGGAAQDAGLAADLPGTGAALVVDALATGLATVLLALLPRRRPQPKGPGRPAAADLLSSIKQGLVYLWRHGTLRTLVLIVAAINLFTTGPLYLGLPVLADARLPGGAAALGLLTSALGAGALLGTALAGLRPRPVPRRLGLVLALVVGVSAGGVLLLGLASSTISAALVALGIGAFLNYVQVTVVTWMQVCTPRALMGRVMSLVTLK